MSDIPLFMRPEKPVNGSTVVKLDLKKISLIIGIVSAIGSAIAYPLLTFEFRSDAKDTKVELNQKCQELRTDFKEDIKEVKEDVKEIKKILMRQESRRRTDD